MQIVVYLLALFLFHLQLREMGMIRPLFPSAGYLRPLPPHSAPSARIMGAAWLRIIDQQRIFLLTPLRPWNSEPFSRNPTKNGRHFKSFQFARAKRCPASVLFGSRATFGYGHLLTLYLVILVLTFSSVNVLFRLVCIWIGWELFHLGPRPLLVTFVIYGTQRTALFNVPGNAPASCSSIFLFFFKKRKLALILAPSLTLSFTTIFSHYHIPDQMRKFFTQVLAPSTVLLLEPILISFISNFYVFFLSSSCPFSSSSSSSSSHFRFYRTCAKIEPSGEAGSVPTL